MDFAHLHLLTNHIPILGAIFALALIVWALLKRSDVLLRTALQGMVLIGLVSVGVYFTGEPAEHAIRTLPDFSRPIAHAHEEAAELATIAMGVVTLVAAFLLWRSRGRAMSRAEGVVALCGALVVSAMMGYAGFMGGRVRHTEIRPAGMPADTTARLSP
jgi:xanthine/uracil permease